MLIALGVSGCVEVSSKTPQQDGALAWVENGHLVFGFFVDCNRPASSRTFTSITVMQDGFTVWAATARDSSVKLVDSFELGVALDGFAATTFDEHRLRVISDPDYVGQLGISVVDLAGNEHGSSLNLFERKQLTDGVVVWSGQRTRSSAVTCEP